MAHILETQGNTRIPERVKTVQEEPGWNYETIRRHGEAMRKIEEDQRAKLEEHEASIFTGIKGSWLYETGTGIATTMASDAVKYEQDDDFDVKGAMADDVEEFSPEVEWEQEVLRSAKSDAHYDVLRDRIKSKREFMLNAQDLGILPTLGLQLVSEFGNIPNYFSFGLSGLAKVNKLKRFLVSGSIIGTANVAEEKFIASMYHDRTATDYIAAGAMGMGLGWLGTLGGDAKLAKHIDDTGNKFADVHIKNEVDEKFEDFKGSTAKESYANLVRQWRKLKRSKEDVTEVEKELNRMSTVGAEQIQNIHKAFNPGFDAKLHTPRMDEDNDFVQSAFASFMVGDIPRADKIWTEDIHLASMAQSLHSSENPLSRYMAKLMVEYPEGVGRWNDHTISLATDLEFQRYISTYAPEYTRISAAWNVLAEQGTGVKYTFDEAASIFIQGKGFVDGSSMQMNHLLDEFDGLYTKMNERTLELMRASGVEEAAADMDASHLGRRWDGEAFHKLKQKYGDDVVVETIQESILNSGSFKKAHANAQRELEAEFKAKNPEGEYKGTTPEEDAHFTSLAIYNRFLNRATVNTADSNLLSSSNRTLLNDALNDVPMSDAQRKHIDATLESLGRDNLSNPMKHQVGMDLGYIHKSGLSVQEFMHTDLGSAFAAQTKYWLGRSMAAKQGIPSEAYFNKAIEQIRRHGTDRGQDVKEINADVARLEAAWKIIKGQPIEDMSQLGLTAMRVVRKAMGVSALGKLGIVQAGETGRVLAAVGMRNIWDTIPAMKDMAMHMIDGRLDTATLKDFEDFALGKIGDDHYMSHPAFRAHDFGHKVGPKEKALDRMSFWLSKASLWHGVHTVQKKYLMNGLAQKWRRELLDGTLSEIQMKDLGLPIHQIEGMRKMLKKYSTKIEGTRTYNLNIGKWEPELRETFALMLHRKSQNAIQDINVGETPLWMNKGLGKFIGQFRTFSVAALGKQTIHDWRMYKEGDKEAAMAMQFMIMTSGMAIMARVGFDAASLPEKERKKYLQRNLNPKTLAFRAMSYHGQVGPLLDITDILASSFTPNTWGQLTGTSMYRNGRGLTGRVPGLSYINRAAKGATGVAKGLLPGESMSKSDWKAFTGTLPLSSWYGSHILNKRVLTPLLFD